MVGSAGEAGPLFRLVRGVVAGGEVIFLGRFGLVCVASRDCFCKLPVDVLDLNGSVVALVPILASPATLSLANAASDLLLLLVISPEEAE